LFEFVNVVGSNVDERVRCVLYCAALPGQDEPVLNGSTAVQSLPATTRSRTLGWLDISLWTGGKDKQSTSDSVEDFEYLEQQPTSPASSSNRTADERPDDTSSEEGGTLAVGGADDSRSKSGTGVRANSTTRDPLSGGKRGKIGSSSSWQDRSSTAAGRSTFSHCFAPSNP